MIVKHLDATRSTHFDRVGEKHSDEILYSAGQRQEVNLLCRGQRLVDGQSAEELERRNLAGHPAHMDLVAGRDEDALVVVAPRHRSHRALEIAG